MPTPDLFYKKDDADEIMKNINDDEDNLSKLDIAEDEDGIESDVIPNIIEKKRENSGRITNNPNRASRKSSKSSAKQNQIVKDFVEPAE